MCSQRSFALLRSVSHHHLASGRHAAASASALAGARTFCTFEIQMVRSFLATDSYGLYPNRTGCIATNVDACCLSLVLAAAVTVPDSIKRVGQAEAFPNEYPGQNYAFNWCLNGDGVTPLKKSAFRITKPLDLKVAGLALPKKQPLQVSKRGIRRYRNGLFS
jgi:hypothetical protein